jgi:hypothetical protein
MDAMDDMDAIDSVESIREALSGGDFHLDKSYDEYGIFAQVDAFVNLSRDNETVEEVMLWLPFIDRDNDASGTHRYAIWDKIAEGIGNLQALSQITITQDSTVHQEYEYLVPDWEILTCILLRRLRQGIRLCMQDGAYRLWDRRTLPAFAGVIHGDAMITGFSTGNYFPFWSLNILCSALLTLPALTNVSFKQDYSSYSLQGPEERQSLESMVRLLQSPPLREVHFKYVVFTKGLSQAVAKALTERSVITDLRIWKCPFPEGVGAVIASALRKNTSLKCLHFDNGADEVFCEVLAAALLSNSTLQNLVFDGSGSCSWLPPLFLALQVNSGLKELRIDGINLIDEEGSTAMKLGLGNNSTLELLDLKNIMGHTDTSLWREALSFLRTNTTLKALHMCFEGNATVSYATTIRMEVLAMLRENESLETLFMPCRETRFEDYPVFVSAIQPNTTLKSLCLYEGDSCLDEDKMKDLMPFLTKNYRLEEIPGLRIGAGDVNSILQLNQAGRHYLIEDGFSISKGVAVLSRVNDDINSVLFHLLENPILCNRSAVEMSSSSIGNMDNSAGSTPVASGNRRNGEKREQQAPSQTDKESRRRLE